MDALAYTHTNLSLDKDEVIAEWTDGVIGNNYPTPSRVLTYTEKILATYLENTLFLHTNLSNTTDIFPTEDGTAVIYLYFQYTKKK